jgi:acyl carrier protein
MTKQEISTFCVDQLAEILRIPKDQIDVNAKFARLGLDSAMTVYLLMELEDRLDLELSPETFYDCPTVDALSVHLAEKVAARAQPAAAR